MLEASVQPEASIASTGFGIRWVGERCYAYSGSYNVDTTAFTMLKWDSGALGVKGTFYGYGPIKFDSTNINTGKFGGFQISFNGQVIALMKADTSQHDMGQVMQFRAIIPPQTIVLVEGLSNVTDAGFVMECTFTGKAIGVK